MFPPLYCPLNCHVQYNVRYCIDQEIEKLKAQFDAIGKDQDIVQTDPQSAKEFTTALLLIKVLHCGMLGVVCCQRLMFRAVEKCIQHCGTVWSRTFFASERLDDDDP